MRLRSVAILIMLSMLSLAGASKLTVSVAQEAAGNSGVPVIVDKSATGELAFWNSIKDSKKPEDFKTYIVNFPNGMFQDPALERYEKTGGNPGDLKNLASVKVDEPAATVKTDSNPVVSQPIVKSKTKAKSVTKSKTKANIITKLKPVTNIKKANATSAKKKLNKVAAVKRSTKKVIAGVAIKPIQEKKQLTKRTAFAKNDGKNSRDNSGSGRSSSSGADTSGDTDTGGGADTGGCGGWGC